jgi:diguanylate cyclase (GGDEF)-like protein/PAS domain S-box-containing protein
MVRVSASGGCFLSGEAGGLGVESQNGIQRLTQIYQALGEINQAIVRMSDEAGLFPLICRVAVEFGGARMAWIGVHHADTDLIVPVESYGSGTEYLEGIRISVREDAPEGRGPSATSFRENRAVFVNHYMSSPVTGPWCEQARRFGWNSGGSFPIMRGGRPYAVLGVYHVAEDFFDAQTVALFDELCGDIGFALDNFERERQRREALEALQTSERHFRAYFERSMVGMAATLPDKSWMEVNDALCGMLGYTREALMALTWAEITHPDDLADNEEIFGRLLRGEINEFNFEKRFLRKDGGVVNVYLAARGVRNADGSLAYLVVLIEDITLRKQAEVRDRMRRRALEAVARGAELQNVMNEVIHSVEATDSAMVCSILVLDEERRHLKTGAAPSLPAYYNEGVNGLEIGPGVGSCGTAAYTGERTVVEEIATHPFWPESFRVLAARAGLAASWSEPIRSAAGLVLGTFAIYYRHPAKPDAQQIALIEDAANLVGIALERHRAEEERNLASLIYRGSSEAMLVTDAQNRVVAINPAFTRVTGYEIDEIRGKDPAFLRSGRHGEEFYRELWEDVNKTGFWQGQIWNRRKNGEIFPEWITLNTVRDANGEVLRYVALSSDVTDKVRSDELIWRQANFDFLTDLPNRYMLHDRLEQELRKAHRERSQLALLFIDLDGFKEVNDTLGHPVGDRLLVEAARRISDCVRESDTVARLGGDEFTVILSRLADAGAAERVAQQIIAALSEPYVFDADSVYVTASVGITLYPDDSSDIEQLLRNADQAMYAAKNAGRNRLSYFTPALQESAQYRLRLVNDLRGALQARQFSVHFQPILELAGGRVAKAEALLRWEHPELGMIGPQEFIPLAEETGLILSIGDWVFREAARWAKRWSGLGSHDLQVSVNMSPVQFHSDTPLVPDWLGHLQTLGVSESCISVEITEGLLLNALPTVTDKLLAFRDAGIQVAIDDFGTGYSALSYLKRFDIDYLKIDRSFVHNLEHNSNDLALSEAIVSMAHKLGLQVVAEGVETEVQRRRLTDIGCDYGQGYLFSKPLPADDFEQFLLGAGGQRIG